MSRAKVNLQIVFLLALIIGLASGQSQNLCGTRNTNHFVQDHSACRSYLFCNFNATQFVSVHQLMCPSNHNFNEFLQACDGTGATACDNSQPTCPLGTTLMIADATDPQCSRFHLCSNGNLIRNAGMCNFPAVFNRNFGTCTSANIAPCIGIVDGYCPPGQTGFFPVWDSCTRHVFCRNGEIEAWLECPPGTHFDPMTRGCVNPQMVMPPCPFA